MTFKTFCVIVSNFLGNVTNSKKTVYRGKSVLAFAMGSRKFYDLIDNNTCFLFGSVGFTNAVPVIMAQHRMISINSAIEIDLCGQVCSDTIGSKFFSGKLFQKILLISKFRLWRTNRFCLRISGST